MCQVEDRGGNPIQAYLQSPIQSIHICLYHHKYNVSWVSGIFSLHLGKIVVFTQARCCGEGCQSSQCFGSNRVALPFCSTAGVDPDWERVGMFIHSRSRGSGMPLQCPFTPLSFVLAAAAGLLSSLVPASPFLGHSFASCPETLPVWNVLYLEKSLLALQNWIYWQSTFDLLGPGFTTLGWQGLYSSLPAAPEEFNGFLQMILIRRI